MIHFRCFWKKASSDALQEKPNELGRAISPELEQLLAARSVYTAPADRTRRLPMLERSERPILCAAPILAHGDIEGGVLLPGTGRDALPEEEAVHAVATAAAFLAKWMEE